MVVVEPVAPEASAEPVAAPVPSVPRYVLVSADARFYGRPSGKAYSFRLTTSLPTQKRKREQGSFGIEMSEPAVRVVAFRWAAEQPSDSDWVHLQTTGVYDERIDMCDFEHPGGYLDIDLYVRRDELLKAVTDATIIRGDQGTTLVLAPGVALRPGKRPGNYRAETPYLQVQLDVPQNKVGYAFTLQPRFPYQRSQLYSAGPLVVAVGSHSVSLTDLEVALVETTAKGSKQLIVHATSCSQVSGLGTVKKLTEAPTSGAPASVSMHIGPYINANSTLYWGDGKKAGSNTHRLMLESSERRGEVNGLQCFESTRFLNVAAVRMCVEPAAVGVHK